MKNNMYNKIQITLQITTLIVSATFWMLERNCDSSTRRANLTLAHNSDRDSQINEDL